MKDKEGLEDQSGEKHTAGQPGGSDVKAALAELVDAVAEQRQAHSLSQKRSWLTIVTTVLLFVLVTAVLIVGGYLYQQRESSSSLRENELKRQLVEVKNELTREKARYESLDDDFKHLVEQNQQLQRDHISEKGALTDAREASMKVSLERDALQQRIISLEDDHKESISRLKATVASEQELIREQIEFKREEGRLKELLKAAQAELAALSKNNRKALAINDQLKAQLEEVSESHQQYKQAQQAKNSGLEQSWAQTKSQLSGSKQEIESLKNDILVAMATIEKIQNRNQRLIAGSDQKDKLILQGREALLAEEKKVRALEHQLDLLNRELSVSKKPLDEERPEERALLAEIEQLQKQLVLETEKSKEQQKASERALADQLFALNESKVLVTRTEAKVRTLEAKVAGLEKQREKSAGSADEVVNELRAQIAQLHQALLAERTYLAEELEKRKQVEGQLSQREDALLDKINRVESQRKEDLRRVTRLKRELTAAQKRANNSETQKVRLEEELEKKNQIIASYEKEATARATLSPNNQYSIMDGRFSVTRNAVVRDKPTVESERLGILTGGTVVRVTAWIAGSNWYRMDDSQHGEGYIFGELLLNQLFESAVRARDRGKNREAAKLFAQVLDQEPWHYQAMMNLALMYAQGQGVQKDAAKALDYYTKVAEQSDESITGEALYNAGIYYLSGWGVEPSIETARHYLKQAAARGVSKARAKLRDLGE